MALKTVSLYVLDNYTIPPVLSYLDPITTQHMLSFVASCLEKETCDTEINDKYRVLQQENERLRSSISDEVTKLEKHIRLNIEQQYKECLDLKNQLIESYKSKDKSDFEERIRSEYIELQRSIQDLSIRKTRNITKGKDGEQMVYQLISEYFPISEIIDKSYEKHSCDLSCRIDKYTLLIEVKNKETITSNDVLKFERDIKTNSTSEYDGYLFVSMKEDVSIPNIGKYHLSFTEEDNKPVLYVTNIIQEPLLLYLGITILLETCKHLHKNNNTENGISSEAQQERENTICQEFKNFLRQSYMFVHSVSHGTKNIEKSVKLLEEELSRSKRETMLYINDIQVLMKTYNVIVSSSSLTATSCSSFLSSSRKQNEQAALKKLEDIERIKENLFNQLATIYSENPNEMEWGTLIKRCLSLDNINMSETTLKRYWNFKEFRREYQHRFVDNNNKTHDVF